LESLGREGNMIVWDKNEQKLIKEIKLAENELHSFCKTSSMGDLIGIPIEDEISSVQFTL
jgi:hypothetical protein